MSVGDNLPHLEKIDGTPVNRLKDCVYLDVDGGLVEAGKVALWATLRFNAHIGPNILCGVNAGRLEFRVDGGHFTPSQATELLLTHSVKETRSSGTETAESDKRAGKGTLKGGGGELEGSTEHQASNKLTASQSSEITYTASQASSFGGGDFGGWNIENATSKPYLLGSMETKEVGAVTFSGPLRIEARFRVWPKHIHYEYMGDMLGGAGIKSKIARLFLYHRGFKKHFLPEISKVVLCHEVP